MHGFPLREIHLAEKEDNLETYFKNIVLQNNRDAQGMLLYLVPIILDINIKIHVASNELYFV